MFRNRRDINDIMRAFDEMFEHFNAMNGKWKTQTRVSDDGTYRVTSFYFDDNRTQNKSPLSTLKQQLDEAIENEDFEKAVELRDKIKNLESNQKEVEKLELELKQSIEEQDFEKSIEIRDQLRKLK